MIVAYPFVFVDPEPVSMAEPRQRLTVGKFPDFIVIPLTNGDFKPSQDSSPLVMLNISIVSMGDDLETSELTDIILSQRLMTLD